MAAKKKMGRPREHDREALLQSLLDYIESKTFPVISEWAYQNGVPRQKAYAMPELSDALQLAITKKEANLELYALAGKIPVAMAIMSLKQIGWSDRQRIDVAEAENVPVGLAGFYAAIGESCDGDS